MDRNEKFATFSGSVVTGLTLVFCLSPTFWIICFGSLLLIVSFSLLAKFEGLWGQPLPNIGSIFCPWCSPQLWEGYFAKRIMHCGSELSWH